MTVEDPQSSYSPYLRSRFIRIVEIPLAIGLLYLVIFSGLTWTVEGWLENLGVTNGFFIAGFLMMGIGFILVPTLWKILIHPLGRCLNCGKSPLHTSSGISDWVYLKHPWQSALTRDRFWPETECSDCRANLISSGNTQEYQ